VRNKDTEYAIDFLEQAAVGEKAIYFARHNSGKGHRRELGGRTGGWPVKSVKFVLGVVKSAHANAVKLGLGPTKIVHIIANKENTLPRMSPKGRRIVHNYETAFVELVLEESQDIVDNKSDVKKKGEVKKADAPKQSEAQKAPEQKKAEAAPVKQ